jgi:glycosyltransferase involved in cell wall biosynthesis
MFPRVTIGVCVRNSEESIKEALNSIMAQDYPHEQIKLVIVDDGSEDGTLSIIKDSVKEMDIATVVLSTSWKGLGHARNEVIANSEGDFIIWVDGDMTIPKEHVAKQVQFMEKNPKIGIAKARYNLSLDGPTVAVLETLPFVLYYSQNRMANDEKLPGTGGSVYRVTAIREVGGFNNEIKTAGEDIDAAYRVRKAGWMIAKSPTFFNEKARQTWQGLWHRYFSHGRSLYKLYHQNKTMFSLYRFVPLAGFVSGAIYVAGAFKLTRKKTSLLLPFHFAFKMIPWCLGFMKGQIDDFLC